MEPVARGKTDFRRLISLGHAFPDPLGILSPATDSGLYVHQ